VYVGEPGSSLEFELPVTTATGVVYLGDHPMVSGRRTLTLKLAMNHQPFRNAGAQAILRNVVIEGERGGAA
jgi:hypothetical protein